jgi:hypothetical protein
MFHRRLALPLALAGVKAMMAVWATSNFSAGADVWFGGGGFREALLQELAASPATAWFAEALAEGAQRRAAEQKEEDDEDDNPFESEEEFNAYFDAMEGKRPPPAGTPMGAVGREGIPASVKEQLKQLEEEVARVESLAKVGKPPGD